MHARHANQQAGQTTNHHRQFPRKHAAAADNFLKRARHEAEQPWQPPSTLKTSHRRQRGKQPSLLPCSLQANPKKTPTSHTKPWRIKGPLRAPNCSPRTVREKRKSIHASPHRGRRSIATQHGRTYPVRSEVQRCLAEAGLRLQRRRRGRSHELLHHLLARSIVMRTKTRRTRTRRTRTRTRGKKSRDCHSDCSRQGRTHDGQGTSQSNYSQRHRGAGGYLKQQKGATKQHLQRDCNSGSSRAGDKSVWHGQRHRDANVYIKGATTAGATAAGRGQDA